MPSSLITWGREELATHADAVLSVYAAAMEVSLSSAQSRRVILTTHLERPGLRGVAAVRDDQLVGIAYGFHGEPGQWWHDQVFAALRPDQADWMRCSFEVCELHVHPSHQGQGLGRSLLDTLLTGTGRDTAVLTTPDEPTRARAFYRAAGWQDLVRGLTFPGDPRVFAVLGKELETGVAP